MIHLIFLGKKSDLDLHIQKYAQRMKSHVQIDYQKKFTQKSKIIFACDERGEKFSSLELARELEKYQFNLDILVGADDGIPKEKFQKIINLSPFVLAHDIARLVLTEQVYRALSIYKRHPYHRV